MSSKEDEDLLSNSIELQDVEDKSLVWTDSHSENDKLLIDKSTTSSQDLDDELIDTRLEKDIKWKDSIIRVYPLDYKRVTMVKFQIFVCLLMFIVFGFNDQTTGALLPTLVEFYDISAVQVSNIFIIQLVAYTISSLLNESIHKRFGMRGAMIIACGLCIIFFSILIMKPKSFNVYLLCGLPLGLSIGILDASGNVLFGNLTVHKNEWMGILHAVYGAAAMVTSPIVSHFVKWGYWSLFFILPLVCSIIGMAITIPSFKFETAIKYDYTCAMSNEKDEAVSVTDEEQGSEIISNKDDTIENRVPESFFQILSIPTVALHSLLLFFYLGAEITTGAWFFTYLLENKLNDKIKMSYIASMFWIGLTCGRLILGFVTKRVFATEYRATRCYTILTFFAYVLFVLLGLVDSHSVCYFILISINLFLCGFFIGPIFPSASIVSLQILPARLHVGGIGVAVAAGGCGGALLPYLAGVIFHLIGSQWMPFVNCILVGIMAGCWCLYPYFIKTEKDIF